LPPGAPCENFNLELLAEGADDMGNRFRIAINTGGGDAPGLNAVIYAVTMAAAQRGWEVHGILQGYAGLFDTSKIVPLSPERVAGIMAHGGTILGTTNKGDPFHRPYERPDGTVEFRDDSDRLITNFNRLGFDVMVALGGDGSLQLAHRLSQKGLPVVGVPKTIDNDLAQTLQTFGFDTAVTTATEAIDKLHSTAAAHERVMVVEVMGRYAGWIALHSGVSGDADVILIPEIPFDMEKVCERIMECEIRGKRYGIVVVAEGAKVKGGDLVTRENADVGRAEVMLGGIAEFVAKEIHQRTGKETRSLVLGHLQRGGSPTTWDRLLSLRFGAAAIRFIAEGKRNVMVAWQPPEMRPIPIVDVIGRTKLVPLESDTIQTCRDLGISLGD
jgi:ATP-dependent phosphofructokinase / diphosphate-dependent phosphofructokinase